MNWQEIDGLLDEMEQLQIQKVFDLARRLKPGLTLEDMRNPHDFPELGDNDWHYEDGILTGIQGVRSAMRARWGITPRSQALGEEPGHEEEP